MSLGISFLLIALGAVLAFAVHAQVNGVDIQVVGWILLVVGIVALCLSLILWSDLNRIRRHRDFGGS